MTRKPAKRAELSLFADAPRAATAPQPPRPAAPFTHPCHAPGCRAWGAFGFRRTGERFEQSRFFCAAHRHLGEAAPTEA